MQQSRRAQTDFLPFADPASEVFEQICDYCGYSLCGLKENRCPECGMDFDPSAAPLARIPWLYRRQIGLFNAYLRTVLKVVVRPGKFAREFRSFVRPSTEDARVFKSTTIWLVVGSFLLFAAPVICYQIFHPGTANYAREIVRDTAMLTWAAGTIYLFLRLATTFPESIQEEFQLNKLAHVQDYAVAPLAILPFFFAIGAGICFVQIKMGPIGMFSIWTMVTVTAIGLLMWVTTFRIISVAARLYGSQLLILAAYTPIHWMFSLCVTCGFSMLIVAFFVVGYG